jgi:hypothetical protein
VIDRYVVMQADSEHNASPSFASYTISAALLPAP